MRLAPVYPMAPVRDDAPLSELGAWLEADQTDRDYMETYRQHGFLHPLTTALSEYRAVAQTRHANMEYSNVHTICGCEHISHSHEDGGTGHEMWGVVAGQMRAAYVGRVCDECAATCMADFLIGGEGA